MSDEPNGLLDAQREAVAGDAASLSPPAAVPVAAAPPELPAGIPVTYILSAGDDREKFDAANQAAIEQGMRHVAKELLAVDGVLANGATGDSATADVVVILDGALRTFPARQCDPSGTYNGTWRPRGTPAG